MLSLLTPVLIEARMFPGHRTENPLRPQKTPWGLPWHDLIPEFTCTSLSRLCFPRSKRPVPSCSCLPLEAFPVQTQESGHSCSGSGPLSDITMSLWQQLDEVMYSGKDNHRNKVSVLLYCIKGTRLSTWLLISVTGSCHVSAQ